MTPPARARLLQPSPRGGGAPRGEPTPPPRPGYHACGLLPARVPQPHGKLTSIQTCVDHWHACAGCRRTSAQVTPSAFPAFPGVHAEPRSRWGPVGAPSLPQAPPVTLSTSLLPRGGVPPRLLQGLLWGGRTKLATECAGGIGRLVLGRSCGRSSGRRLRPRTCTRVREITAPRRHRATPVVGRCLPPGPHLCPLLQ